MTFDASLVERRPHRGEAPLGLLVALLFVEPLPLFVEVNTVQIALLLLLA